ncbi:hypothetical protein T08_10803 [Trichinella sp. T8]|nr:hypothetical protein T08_10803 [Trichinella sp. T8]
MFIMCPLQGQKPLCLRHLAETRHGAFCSVSILFCNGRRDRRSSPVVSLDLQPLIRAAIAKPDVYVPTPVKRPGARFRALPPQPWRFYWKKNRLMKRQPNSSLVWIDIDDDQDSAEMKNEQKRGGGRYVNWHFANDADWKRGGGRYFPWYDGPWSHYWKTV